MATTVLEWLYESEGLLFFLCQSAILICAIGLSIYCRLLLRERSYARLGRSVDQIRTLPISEWSEQIAGSSCPFGKALGELIGNSRFSSAEAAGKQLEILFVRVEVVFDRSLRMLAVMAQVSVLVGLLGTVWGLAGSFSVISQHAVPPPNELALGVSQALSTTIVGLCTAIPVFLVHAWLQGRADQLLVHLSTALNAMAEQFGQ